MVLLVTSTPGVLASKPIVYQAATNQVGDRVALYHGVSLKVLENISSAVLDGSAVTPVSKKHKPPNERPTVCTF